MSCKLNIMKQKLYHFDTAFYSIEFGEKYKESKEAKKALRRYYAKFIRMMNDERFRGISICIGISNQDGKTATKTVIATEKKGRPHIKVISNETKEWHIHCIIYGRYASSFCQEFIEYYRKKNSSSIRKYKLKHGADYVPYCYNQCINWLTHGTFDFSKLYNPLEWKQLEEDNLILSYKTSEPLHQKANILSGFSTLRKVYVIPSCLSTLTRLYPSIIKLETIRKKLERIYQRRYAYFVMPKNFSDTNFAARVCIMLQ